MAGCSSTILTTTHKCSLSFPLYISRCIYYFLLGCKTSVSQSFIDYQQKVNRIRGLPRREAHNLALQSKQTSRMIWAAMEQGNLTCCSWSFKRKTIPMWSHCWLPIPIGFIFHDWIMEGPNLFCFDDSKITYFQEKLNLCL